MTDKFITLPGSEEILRRLKTVSDDDVLIRSFFPLIAKEAGHELVAEGIPMMFALKIYEFINGGGYPSFLGGLLHLSVPNYIDALVDDKEIAEAAKSFYQESMDAMRKSRSS